MERERGRRRREREGGGRERGVERDRQRDDERGSIFCSQNRVPYNKSTTRRHAH